MKPSKHNILSKIADSENYFIINLLSQQADILSKHEYELFVSGKANDNTTYIEKGYIIDTEIEQKLYRNKYLEFIDTRETDEVQIFYVPSYACNFACSYCYQDEYGNAVYTFNKEVVDAFFKYIDDNFINRRKYITVFGGEPFLNTSKQKDFFNYFIHKANQRNLDLSFVTNGYFLRDYIPIIKEANIREIQVTIDGTSEEHNKRRMLRGGGKTFNEIVEGIDKALENSLLINLRMVIDKQNINELPKLARFAIDRGWTKSPYFKTQLGRNYELHHCQSGASRLYSRIEMYRDIYNLLKEHSYITEFYKPSFSVSKFLFEEGTLPDPLFDSCPGTKTEWAFDYSGKIYSCTATVGKPGEELGTFYPAQVLDIKQIEEWQERDVLSIDKCKECSLQLVCGGGCASVAKNSNGNIKSADCRPVKELLELGIAHYFEN